MTQKECRAFYDDDGNWKLTYEGEIFRTFLLKFEDLKFYRTQALITILDFSKPSISRGKIPTKARVDRPACIHAGWKRPDHIQQDGSTPPDVCALPDGRLTPERRR
jgi:hypothetical protein